MAQQPQYAEMIGKTQEAVAKSTDMWSQGFQKLLGDRPFGALGQPASFDPAQLIDPIFESAQNLFGQNPFAGRLLEINRSFTKDVLDGLLSLQGVMRQHTEALFEAVRDQVGTNADIVKEQTNKVAQVAEDQAAEAEKAARRAARQAEKAARDAVAEQYAEYIKVELQEELETRGLPKSGTVDELRERLIDDDLAAASV